MTDWSWVTIQGATGEIPVRILSNESVEFLLETEREISIESFHVLSDDDVQSGDVCIFRTEIAEVSPKQGSIGIEIAVLGVEYVRKAERENGEVEKMMSHLQTAKERQRRKEESKKCANCRDIDADTQLTVETRRNRDLHYCAECDRLLSTKEYERWKAVNW